MVRDRVKRQAGRTTNFLFASASLPCDLVTRSPQSLRLQDAQGRPRDAIGGGEYQGEWFHGSCIHTGSSSPRDGDVGHA